MNKGFIYVIGLMSGTSLDGLDLVYIKFDKDDYSNFQILCSETKSYNADWYKKLSSAIFFSDKELNKLDKQYGFLLGELVNDFVKSNHITKIDFIASHGHTVLHQPEKGITLQVGNGQIIANETRCKVVCDFRTQDVQLGGQGAPLVPIGDEQLFSEYSSCLNLGGFANISFNEDNKRIAFDICPVNIVLNHYVKKFGFDFDDKGIIASQGTINKNLLKKLNLLEFYNKRYPKSLGLEWVQIMIFPLIDKFNLSIKDILKTFVEHIAIQITTILKNKKNVIVTGGGVFNEYLIHRVSELTDTEICIPDFQLINYKEALIFAFLGMLKLDNQINCLSSVTGAKKDHSSGKIFLPEIS